jgi:glucose/arabinose dehydrogenase
MRQRLSASSVLIGLLSIGLISAASAQPGGGGVMLPDRDKPLEMRAGRVPFRVVLVADGLVGPWDIEFLPDGAMLVNEMNGRMRIIRDGVLKPEPVWESPSPDSNDVLHGLAVHPDFQQNRWVYASYTKANPDDPGLLTLALSRGRLVDDKLVDVEEIFVADAWEPAPMATAGRMLFDPDGTLYLTVGDRDSLCCQPVDDNHIRMRSQSLADHVGKTLRLTDDGGVPPDNPFVGDPDARDEIFTYGNRNGYGLDFNPETGELWQLEIGPMGGDEINILVPGGNYGWPLVSMGRNYSGTLVSDQPWYRDGMINPRVFWVPAISPSSIQFYTGDAFPQWQGSLFVTALSGQHVERLSFGQPGQAESREEMLGELGVRFRDVEQGPDGFVYLATEVRYGSGRPDGTVIRLEPMAQ